MYAEKRWRRIRIFEHLAKVFAGVQFKDGIEVTENTETGTPLDHVPYTRFDNSLM